MRGPGPEIPMALGCRWRSVLAQGYRKPRLPAVTKAIILDGRRCAEQRKVKQAIDARVKARKLEHGHDA